MIRHVSTFLWLRYVLLLLPAAGGCIDTAGGEQVPAVLPSAETALTPQNVYHELFEDLLSPATELAIFRGDAGRVNAQQAAALIRCIGELRSHLERRVKGTEGPTAYPYVERLLFIRQTAPSCISAEKLDRCVRALVQAGAGVNDFDKTTPEMQSPALHRALTDPELGELCRFLLDKGANTRAKNGAGESALVCASAGNHAALLKSLLATSGKRALGPALVRACSLGNADAVRELLSLGASANAAPSGVPLLLTATACGHINRELKPAADPRAARYAQIAEMLLRKGADPKAADPATGRTALMFACVNGMEELALKLQEGGASATAATLPGQGRRISVAECALLGGCSRVVEKILPVAKYNPSDPYSCRLFLAACAGGILPVVEQGFPHMGPAWDEVWGAEGSTFMPLVEAARYGRMNVVQFLVEKGMNPDVYPYTGETPLLAACRGGYTDVARYLLEKGADPNRASYVTDPLTTACAQGNKELVTLLLEHGATPQLRLLGGTQVCPLAAAVRAGQADSVKSLLDKGMQITSAARAAVMSCRSGRIVRRLSRSAGQDFIAHMRLFRAIEVGNIPAVRRCLNESVPIETRDAHGYTPLMVALLTGRHDIADFLLEHGADKEAQVSASQPATALWLACRMGRTEAVKRLLDIGASVEAPGRDGTLMTPLTVACWYDHREVVRLLLERGANRDARAESGGYNARTVAEICDNNALRNLLNPPPPRRTRRR